MTLPERVLIVGTTGRDGSFLIGLLPEKGYEPPELVDS